MSIYKKLYDTFGDVKHDIDVRFVQKDNKIDKIIFKTVAEINNCRFSTIQVYNAEKNVNGQLDKIKAEQLHEILDDFIKTDNNNNTVDLKDYKDKKDEKIKPPKDNKSKNNKTKNKDIVAENDLEDVDYEEWTPKSLKFFNNETSRISQIRKEMGLTKAELNPYVEEFSKGQHSEITDITPLLIGGFVEFMEGKLASQAQTG